MKSINILHISDVHINQTGQEEISEIVQKLIVDAQKVEKHEKVKIDLICFTGDLIQRGDKAIQDENQFEIARKILIEPLLDAFNLTMEQFIIIPGNHEVDISKIVKATERGLQVQSLEEINEIVGEMDNSYLIRLQYFYEEMRKLYPNILYEQLGYAFLKDVNGIKVGIACVDSAWRSSGSGDKEKGNLYVGEKQIKRLYSYIKSAEIKICMMHHPLEWLSGYETTVIEREMTKFDLVLNGHVHECDDKAICRQNLKTIYNTAGKLYPLDYAQGRAKDGYNGYCIVNIDLEKGVCNLFLRSYYAKDREEFDEAVNICEKGFKTYELNNKEERQMTFNIVKGLTDYFKQMAEKFSLINEIDLHSPMDITEVFIDPILSEESEYMKEKQEDNSEVEFSDVVYSDDNIILIGKKESGRTTILQKIGLTYLEEYEKRECIPVYIDMRYISKKSTSSEKILNEVINFVERNMYDNAYINKTHIKRLIKDGKIVFLFDNIDISEKNHTLLLQNFIRDYGNNRFIFAILEEFFQSLDLKKIPDYGSDFRKIYIHFMGRAQIRELVSKWICTPDNTANVDEIVEKIDGYCNQINFAKTPFNISIFMVLWDSDKNFIPQNEGIVMENYLQVVLEKLSEREGDRSTYSFQIKQHFLSNMAYEMFKNNRLYFTQEEFELFSINYHVLKGYKEKDSKFNTIFFEKNILSYSEEHIVFSHTSVLEFYLAVYAKEHSEFLDYMMEKDNRTYFANEICFYSGLTLNCTKLLDDLADTIIESIIDHIDDVDKLNDLKIMVDFKMSRDDLVEKLNENRPTQKDIDDIADIAPKESAKKPLETNTKDKSGNGEVREEELVKQLFDVVQIYGSVLKNAELLDNSKKVQHLENYMYAMNILLGEMLNKAEEARDNMSVEDFAEMVDGVEKIPTDEEFEQIKDEFLETVKISFPLALQNLILENVGTPKLEIAINEQMAKKSDKPFEKFMLVFLKCDLKIGDIIVELRKYIKSENTVTILKLALVKLVFYYRGRFFGNNYKLENDIIDLIIEIQKKLNPLSAQVEKNISGNRERARLEIKKRINKLDKIE
ncbi:MAG: metallophosphoesterase [Lachnospiraceae bacterium]|nr:metallophosphoesterase [Lachnospiraceae bacterium]